MVLNMYTKCKKLFAEKSSIISLFLFKSYIITYSERQSRRFYHYNL